MYQHREFLQGDLTQFRLAVNRLCNPARHDQRFEGHTGQNIHRFGKLKTSRELLFDVTGEDFDPHYYVRYLKEKYGKLYGVSPE